MGEMKAMMLMMGENQPITSPCDSILGYGGLSTEKLV